MSHRRLLLSAAAASAILGAGAPAARALEVGYYEVVACDPAVAGGANNSFSPYVDPGMAAYADCRVGGEGLVVRNVFDNGTAPQGARAALIFDAPPGSQVTRITFDGGIERHDCGYSAIIAAGNQDFGGQAFWGLGAGTSCRLNSPSVASFDYSNQSVNTGAATRVRLEAQCVPASCSRGGRSGLRLFRTRVTVSDFTGPSVTAGGGALWATDGWLGGDEVIRFTGQDNTGIRELKVLSDGRPVAAQALPCDVTLRAPCPGTGTLERALSTPAHGADGAHQLRLVATDSAGNEARVDRKVLIDNTAPDAPSGVAVSGGDGWRSANAFDVTWTNAAQTHAPIAAVNYELCRTSGADCVTRVAEGADVQRIERLEVPAAGDWQLKLWLRDAAGNEDRRLIAPPTRLRFDDTSPDPRLQRLSPEDPTQLAVETTDTGSGLASGTVDLRRRGSTVWRAQSVRVAGDRLLATIDDQRLLDGSYEVRAKVSDQAGNERTTQTWSDGSAAEVTMPIRLKTALRAGIRRGSGKRARLARAAFVSYGQRVRVRGRLTTPEGNALAGVTVEALTDIKTATPAPRLIATMKTSRTGAFTFLVRKGPSRTVTIRYGGAPKVRSATRVLQLNVRARSTIRPNRRRLVNGESVRLLGRITTGRVPSAGKLVEVQVFVRGRWRTFATTRSSNRGTWHYDYRFDGTRGVQRYRFRARLPQEAGYPFATGRSSSTAGKVRGI